MLATGWVLPATALVLLAMTAACARAPNLAPAESAQAPDYWCTWYAQNYWVQRGTEITDLAGITNPAAQDTLNSHNLFNTKDGWAATYLKRDRSDFYFLIDHGWQTKNKDGRLPGVPQFFSLQIDPLDFPEYAGLEPQEALRRLNDRLKALGWRGLGIWVRGEVTPQHANEFMKWCKYAGVGYWKIDVGDTGVFNALKARDTLFPGLTIEYALGAVGNLNPHWDRPDLKAYPSVFAANGTDPGLQHQMLDVLRRPVVFRSYDATPILMTPTTLRRAHDILQQTSGNPEFKALLNLQDDCYAAAALGCLVGSMRHPNYGERLYKGKDLHQQLAGKRHMQGRMNELQRFGRWERIAPAFPVGVGTYTAADHELVDSYAFTVYDTWATDTYGKRVYQSAPAIMARNMPLPVVKVEGDAPYVMATTYPNGPVAVATEGRVNPLNQWYEPRATVTIRVKDATQPIGIFGHYNSLVVNFGRSIEGARHVWAQDLMADSARDILSIVKIAADTLTVSGRVIDEVGASAGDRGDISAPGMVLKLALHE